MSDLHRAEDFPWLQQFYCCLPSIANPADEKLREGGMPVLIRKGISKATWQEQYGQKCLA